MPPGAVARRSTLVSGPARGHLKIRFRWRKLSPGRIALIILAVLRHDQRPCGMAGDNEVSTSTVRRWLLEEIEQLSARAPRLGPPQEDRPEGRRLRWFHLHRSRPGRGVGTSQAAEDKAESAWGWSQAPDPQQKLYGRADARVVDLLLELVEGPGTRRLTMRRSCSLCCCGPPRGPGTGQR